MFITFHESNMAYNLLKYNVYTKEDYDELLFQLCKEYVTIENSFNELSIDQVYFAYEYLQ